MIEGSVVGQLAITRHFSKNAPRHAVKVVFIKHQYVGEFDGPSVQLRCMESERVGGTSGGECEGE